MSAHQRFGGTSDANRNQSYFEEQRAALLGDIAGSFEQVLANINKLNRSLEAVITVGNEFASVETLWSQFENVMAKDPKANNDKQDDDEGEAGVKREE